MIKVKTKHELINIVRDGKILLETVDISGLTDLSSVFAKMSHIYGSISDWDVSHIEDMGEMFYKSTIQPDISKWDVSSVTDMSGMFQSAEFKGDISSWNTSSVIDMSNMFYSSDFNGDLSKWDVSKVEFINNIFSHSRFNSDISNWNISSVKNFNNIFSFSDFGTPLFDAELNKVRVSIGKWNFLTENENNDLLKNNAVTPNHKVLLAFENSSSYTITDYFSDRQDYLRILDYEKKLDESLNKDIELDTIEFEF